VQAPDIHDDIGPIPILLLWISSNVNKKGPKRDRFYFILDYSRAKTPTRPNINVGEEVAHEAVFEYREWAAMKPMW
jgi:hypothetical protein